jgi:alkylation response protein AidB-like acyl-CoA dehydrogenase
MGWNAQPTRQVIFEDARVAGALLGEEGRASASPMQGLDGGRSTSAPARSAARRPRSTSRWPMCRSGGLRAGSRQVPGDAVPLADMATELEAARTLLWRAWPRLGLPRRRTPPLLRHGQALLDRCRLRVADEALQLLGGYGYLAEYGIEKIVRDLRVHRILEGTNEIMRLIVSRDMLGRR